MITITGDMHGNLNRLINALYGLDKTDYLFVAGDFGFVYYNDEQEQNVLDFLEKKDATIVFAEGNHENFTALYDFPIVDFHGGKAHKIRTNIFHLMRGQIYEIEGHSFFTFGGAYSADKERRNPGTSWWPEEIANEDEINEAWKNLESHNYTVDYIITHQVPGYLQNQFVDGNTEYLSSDEKDSAMLRFFDRLSEKVIFKKWYCGHMHQDKELSQNVQIVYFGLETLV